MNLTKFTATLLAIGAILLVAGCSTDTPMTPGTPSDAAVKSVDRMSLEGSLILGEDIDPGEVRNPGGRVTIVTGNAYEVELTGGIAAETIFVQDSRWNARGNGAITGAVEICRAEVAGVEGSLMGQFTGILHEFYLTADVVLRGAGDLAGCHIKLHFEGEPGSDSFAYTAEAMIDDRDWIEIEPDGAVRPNF